MCRHVLKSLHKLLQHNGAYFKAFRVPWSCGCYSNQLLLLKLTLQKIKKGLKFASLIIMDEDVIGRL